MLIGASSDAASITVAVLAPILALLGALVGAWFAASRAGTRQQYADETARNAAFQESKRESYSSLVAALSTLRREPSAEALDKYEQCRERALAYAKERRPAILELLGDDALQKDFDLSIFRERLFDDPGLK